MDHKTEILVIGGGAVGICCAYYLSVLGKSVAVVEKNDIGSGSSYGNAGLIVPSYGIPLAAPGAITQGLKWMFKPESPFYIKPRLDRELLSWLWKFRGACTLHHVRRSIPVLRDLNLASLNLFEELADTEGMDFFLIRNGTLELFNTSKAFKAGVEDVHLMREYGIENQILDAGELTEFTNGLRANAVGGIYFPQDAHLIPDRFIHQLARFVENKGVNLFKTAEVLAFETSGRRVKTIKTTRGSIAAEEVVLTAGSWSAEIARSLQFRIPMTPAKGYSVTYRKPSQCPAVPIRLAEAKTVLTPMDNMLRFAGTLELAGFDQSINLRRVQAILKAVKVYFPDIDPAALDLLEIWRGLRPCSPDGLPYIGRLPRYDNVILATGHGMLGISLAPITGRIVSELAVNKVPDIDMAALSVDRFNY
jgi:D-amino-acid dehydrogenase